MRTSLSLNLVTGVLSCAFGLIVHGMPIESAHAAGASKDAKLVDGVYINEKGVPTYKIGSDGKVDWATYVGYLRVNSNCEECHGPDGVGSTFAPSLTDALKTLTFDQFKDVIVHGKKNISTSTDSVMPDFGKNKNVMCYLDDIYVYLKARSDGKLGRGRPKMHAPKPEAWAKAETACMGF